MLSPNALNKQNPLSCFSGLGRGAKVNRSSRSFLFTALLHFLSLNVCASQPCTLWSTLVLVYALHCFAFLSPTRSLLILFVEIDYWERLLFETPHYVMNVAERAEDLRILRENLLLVARDYNR